MGAVDCLGPTAIEIEIREVVRRVGASVFKLEVTEESILLSIDLVPGVTLSRKAHYVSCSPAVRGRLSDMFIAIRDWVLRKATEHAGK